MADPKNQPPIDLEIYRHNETAPGVTATEVIALVLSVLWITAIGGTFLYLNRSGLQPLDSLRFVMTMLAVFMPVALIWVAATAARSSRIMRQESERLQAAIDAMRQTYVQSQQSGSAELKPTVERKLEEIAAAQRKTEHAIATFTSVRPETEAAIAPAESAQPEAPEAGAEQGTLALGTPAEALSAPVNIPDFIRALHFPENAEDKEGFRALRRAIERPADRAIGPVQPGRSDAAQP